MMAIDRNDRPLEVYEIPPERLAAWDAFDDRVDCGSCARRSSQFCTVTNRTHVPIGIKHRCKDFRKRRGA